MLEGFEVGKMKFLLWIVLGLGCGKKAQTMDPRLASAEYKRLSMEMGRHVTRQRWDKAAKVFEEIEALNTDIEFEDWLLAAEVSQELGLLSDTREYLKKAYEIRSISKVREWRKMIDDEYGDVFLEIKSNEAFTFEPKFQVSDPLKNNALIYARKQLTETRAFSGLLPVGTYQFVDQTFEVQSGLEVVLSLDPKQRKKGLKEPIIKDLEIPE